MLKRLTIALKNHPLNEDHLQDKDKMLWALSVTQMNGLKDVQEEVHGVMNKLKSDSIFHSIMQIRTEKKAARKTDYFWVKKTVRAFELVPLSWVSRTRRNSKLLL